MTLLKVLAGDSSDLLSRVKTYEWLDPATAVLLRVVTFLEALLSENLCLSSCVVKGDG